MVVMETISPVRNLHDICVHYNVYQRCAVATKDYYNMLLYYTLGCKLRLRSFFPRYSADSAQIK